MQRLTRRWLDHGKPPLHFLHIGKTGGTAIKHVLDRTRAVYIQEHRDTITLTIAFHHSREKEVVRELLIETNVDRINTEKVLYIILLITSVKDIP